MNNIATTEIEKMKHLISFGKNEDVSKGNGLIIEFAQKGADGLNYAIARECNKHYIMVAPKKDTEVLAEDYDYLNGFNNRKAYDSYNIASKQFELKMMNLNEAYAIDKPMITESASSDWQVENTKEMRNEINRLMEISNNVNRILEGKEIKAYGDKVGNVDTSWTNDDEKPNEYDVEPVGKSHIEKYEDWTNDDENVNSNIKKTNDVIGSSRTSDTAKKTTGYTENANLNKTDLKESKTVRLTEDQVLAWSRGNDDYMDKSHGTEIGSTAPYGEKYDVINIEETLDRDEDYNDISAKRQEVQDEYDEMCSRKQPIIELENGDYYYIYYSPEEDELQAGGVTNVGFHPLYEVEYDYDFSFDENLQNLYDVLVDETSKEESINESIYEFDLDDEDDFDNYASNMANKAEGKTPGVDVPFYGNDDEYNDYVYDQLENNGDLSDEDIDDTIDPDVDFYIDSVGGADAIADRANKNFVAGLEGTGNKKPSMGSENVSGPMPTEVDNMIKEMIKETVLNDFGKHPAYRKEPFTLPDNHEPSKNGRRWDDETNLNDEEYGKEIGHNGDPYTEKVIEKLAESILAELGKKKKLTERKVLAVPSTDVPPMDVAPMGFDMGNAEPAMDDLNMPMDAPVSDGNEKNYEADFDAGVEADESEDPKKFNQQLAGKISQSIQSYEESLPSPDSETAKFVGGMILSQLVKYMSAEDFNKMVKKAQDKNANKDDVKEPELSDESEEQTEDNVVDDNKPIQEKVKRRLNKLLNKSIYE